MTTTAQPGQSLPPTARTAAVRHHVWQLLALGHTVASVTQQAGVAKGTVDRLMAGWTQTVQQRVADAILAVPVEPPPAPRLVPAVGTKRRIQALATRGWSQAAIAAELGRAQPSIGVLLTRRAIKAETAAAIAELYDRIRDEPPPDFTPRRSGRRSRTRATAWLRGWSPPEAWDAATIDDPHATPRRLGAMASAGDLHANTADHRHRTRHRPV